MRFACIEGNDIRRLTLCRLGLSGSHGCSDRARCVVSFGYVALGLLDGQLFR